MNITKLIVGAAFAFAILATPAFAADQTCCEKAKAAGVPVHFKIFEGMWHVFHTAGQAIPESRQAIDEIGGFVRTLYASVEAV